MKTGQEIAHYIGIDVGGTNIKVGVVDEAGRPLSSTHVATEARKGPESGLANLQRAVEDALAATPLTLDDIVAVGLATPGTMDLKAGILLQPPNLPGWDDFPIRQRVADLFGRPTVLQNDANAAAYGEYWVGAGRDADSMVLWTLGTGIGCGIIIGDLILEGAHSHGAESGHMIIAMDHGRLCEGTGHYGTLEAYAGSKAVVSRCRELLDGGRTSVLTDWLANGELLTPLLIARAAQSGDEVAEEVVMETARCMGVGTVNLMHTIDPDMVLFGGAMTFGGDEAEVGRRFLTRIREEVRRRAFPIPCQKTRLAFASLGNDAGFIGAAGCARLAFRGD